MLVPLSEQRYLGKTLNTQENTHSAFETLTTEGAVNGWYFKLYEQTNLKQSEEKYSFIKKCLIFEGLALGLVLVNHPLNMSVPRNVKLLLGGAVGLQAFIAYLQFSDVLRDRKVLADQISTNADLLLQLAEEKPHNNGEQFLAGLKVRGFASADGEATAEFNAFCRQLGDLVEKWAPSDPALLDKVLGVPTKVCRRVNDPISDID